MMKNLQSQEDDAPPPCYGSEHFLATAPECVGGHDPAWSKNGSHIRPPCDWVQSCSVRSQARKAALIPTSNLVRHIPTTFKPPTAPQPPPQAVTTYRPTWHQPSPPYTPQYGQPQPMGMQQLVPVNYGVPSYLTVREPMDGRSMLARLMVEIFRGLGKSLGQTISHFFDVEAGGGKPGPEQR